MARQELKLISRRSLPVRERGLKWRMGNKSKIVYLLSLPVRERGLK